MKILYTTDLHGSDLYYNTIFKKAQLHDVDLVINGGDLLPKTDPILKQQRKYIKFLENMYFPRWEKACIYYICCPGNDDAKIFDDALADAAEPFEYIHFLRPEGDKIDLLGHEFVGFNLVCDYPFGIKDRCRMDKQGFVFPEQRAPAAFTAEKEHGDGWDYIEDWFSVAQGLPTLEDELKALPRPKDMRKAVYIMHMPPAGLGLDVCQSGDRPAGWSVYEFLDREQPLLSLHGHIHESHQMSGIWKSKIGRTWAVQPGQGGEYPVYCVIDTDELEKMKRFGHDTETLMVDGYIPDGSNEIKFIRISELPAYLIEPFKEWVMGSTVLVLPGMEKYGQDLANASDFERFCATQGIKIKLVPKR